MALSRAEALRGLESIIRGGNRELELDDEEWAAILWAAEFLRAELHDEPLDQSQNPPKK